ncbi:hypothetical protein E2P81_ATG04235 [Venturia nashicola]|uniref:Uncharacterized protein n=1 Tax=Venturia nashicola TaxID=86259 RepID=A0A4Z1PHW7_9PEZI|nr:hypothetical protein E6O75_ATG04336 [Venturia nashicola]TLD37423.1 hypothetical protein E2P81_ATG04235 [Venturia nashicola]
MCFKANNSYMICGCQDTIAHVRICDDRLLKDDFGNGYGYSRCAVADHELTTPEATMQGYCPRCALNNLIVVDDRLVSMSGTMKKMAPLTRLPPKEKKEVATKDKDEQADTVWNGGKMGGKRGPVSASEQKETELIDVGGMVWS